MIYFKANKKDMGMEYIDINIPGDATQLEAYFHTRKRIFCEEQNLFENSDYDHYDQQAIPIVAINHYLGAPDHVVGVVRIYEKNHRHWFGGRLGVIRDYRSFARYVCPHLFSNSDVSGLYELSIAAGLIYRAVSLANYIGCDHFSAYVQEQNVRLFERLHWKCMEEVSLHGVTHVLMEADLEAYPAKPVYRHSITDSAYLQRLKTVA